MKKQLQTSRRQYKGESIIDFPSTYVVVDIETNGLSADSSEIIEIAAIRYTDGIKVDSFSTLIKPSRKIDRFITNLTGITDSMVADAPQIENAIWAFYSYAGSDILVGYNVNFDVNFLYDNLMGCYGIPLTNSFVDVLRIARRVLRHLPNHKQTTVASHYGISIAGAHRAEADCEICNACYRHLQEDICRSGSSLAAFKQKMK